MQTHKHRNNDSSPELARRLNKPANGLGRAENLQIWGGIECSINRVEDRFYDQLERGGHKARLDDLDRVAELGVKALRYPVLWEAHTGEKVDWSWAEERLTRIRELGIEPIVGLLHHGSGPAHTSLVDPDFAAGLAEHAREVAERFPWVKYYTPVNEPLTTARFSCLYGLWYPHHKDIPSFLRALINQTQATLRAMAAIREIQPGAQLVQTEDMGHTTAPQLLAYQATFDNGRRWLSLDLLMGRLTRDHVFWRHFIENGISESELLSIAKAPCPPDIIGINHYITSERYLDDRLVLYPTDMRGGNGEHAYADVPTVRVCREGPLGPYGILKSVWERYKLPIAVTEAHLGCTREEQLRWLMEIWVSARELRREGADIRAVTAWSLFGAHDWNSLLTRFDGCYEPGAFDTRGPAPRRTALARCIEALARKGHFAHPVLNTPGWWRRQERLIYPVSPTRTVASGKLSWRLLEPVLRQPKELRPILITGATGTLGQGFSRLAHQRGLEHKLLSRREMDIADPASVVNAIQTFGPWAIINTAGYVRVDDAENDPDACFRENTRGPEILAAACAEAGIQLVTFSSDLVFDGSKTSPYIESDSPAPLNVYGRSKAEAEHIVLKQLPSALVIRTSALFGPWDKYNFVTRLCRALRNGEPVDVASDQIVSPTYVPDLVHAALDLLLDEESGIWHLANEGQVTWADFAARVVEMDELPRGLIVQKPMAEITLATPRPAFSALASARGKIMPPLEDALRRYLCERSPIEELEPARV